MISFYNCVFNCFGFAMNFVTGIIHTNDNIQMLLAFQKIHRFLKNDDSLHNIIIWNWFFVIVVIGFYVILTCCILRIGIPFFAIYVVYFLIVFDINMVYVIRIVKMLEMKVIQWNVFNSQNSEIMHEENRNYNIFLAYIRVLQYP